MIVTIIPNLYLEWFPAIMAWCAHVTETPEERSTIVLSNGTPEASKGTTPIGGHSPPNSIFGAKLLWKNAQKNLKKNITSEIINRSIPYRNPFSTSLVCRPSKAPSALTSRHHW